jgi:hypothetical protein
VNRLVAGPPYRVNMSLLEGEPDWLYEYPGLDAPEFDLFRFLAFCWLYLEVQRLRLRIEQAHGQYFLRSAWNDGPR